VRLDPRFRGGDDGGAVAAAVTCGGGASPGFPRFRGSDVRGRRSRPVIPAQAGIQEAAYHAVIPAPFPVIPAQAGIQPPALDPRFRGGDVAGRRAIADDEKAG